MFYQRMMRCPPALGTGHAVLTARRCYADSACGPALLRCYFCSTHPRTPVRVLAHIYTCNHTQLAVRMLLPLRQTHARVECALHMCSCCSLCRQHERALRGPQARGESRGRGAGGRAARIPSGQRPRLRAGAHHSSCILGWRERAASRLAVCASVCAGWHCGMLCSGPQCVCICSPCCVDQWPSGAAAWAGWMADGLVAWAGSWWVGGREGLDRLWLLVGGLSDCG